MTFAIITPALIAGAFAERMKFSAMLWFIGLWAILVYAPIAHWVWGADGFLSGNRRLVKVLDFAGGTVVHINAGVAGLMCALVLGKRKGYGRAHGAAQPGADLHRRLAAVGRLVRLQRRLGRHRRHAGRHGDDGHADRHRGRGASPGCSPSGSSRASRRVLGICSGAVAGLVAITPASGFVGPIGALVIGIAAGVVCYWGVTGLKHMLGYDDALDAFGVHGVGGIVGALLTGVFADRAIRRHRRPDRRQRGAADQPGQGRRRSSIVYDAIVSLIILKVIDVVIGLRVTDEVEREGLDLALHGEAVQ